MQFMCKLATSLLVVESYEVVLRQPIITSYVCVDRACSPRAFVFVLPATVWPSVFIAGDDFGNLRGAAAASKRCEQETFASVTVTQPNSQIGAGLYGLVTAQKMSDADLDHQPVRHKTQHLKAFCSHPHSLPLALTHSSIRNTSELRVHSMHPQSAVGAGAQAPSASGQMSGALKGQAANVWCRRLYLMQVSLCYLSIGEVA
eukprot:1137241-Pelagomonas_calceolata.AAC.2